MHSISNLTSVYPNNFSNKTWDQQKHIFLQYLNAYKTTNNKKLKIITVIRNPIERVISAFFQIHYNGEINNHNIPKENTIISKYSADELVNMFLQRAKTKTLLGFKETLDEISKLFDTDIIANLKNNNTHYYYENHLIKLYVLDFNTLISKNTLAYLNSIFKFKLTNYVEFNKSDSKPYSDKYKQFKEICSDQQKDKQIDELIRHRYNKFYFGAF
jgi:hypothetical protein